MYAYMLGYIPCIQIARVRHPQHVIFVSCLINSLMPLIICLLLPLPPPFFPPCSLPQGALRTKAVMERLKSQAAQPGQKPPILVYLGVLLQASGTRCWLALVAECSAPHCPAPPVAQRQWHHTAMHRTAL